MINQYIFYAGVFSLIGIPSFMRMPAAHIKNGEDPMGKYGTAFDIAQYVNLFVCFIGQQKGNFLCSKLSTPLKVLQDKACRGF
ncbi:hypothetical protein NEILACOT_05457 [Neisseria lactamica ATCC 23970]|uniref:Uncharacterized protein n=2 Tax=Neisseria lactamica TaxID=486 RepID=D0WD22_NEILA|nr:hypothetical protein B2G52_00370 [Neisseria lactamica]EEZ74526.1 hypothetical protein NEILACOT_05457 [Neisseria lactamica ATCC 23970]